MTMPTPAEIQDELERGWQYFAYLSAQEAQKATDGCGCCGNKMWPCLFTILNGLQWRVDLSLYDDTAYKLYSDMMEIIGGFTPVVGPSVDAGPDQSINQPTDSVFMNGSVTAGDNPIASIVWSQVSGPSTAIIDDPSSLTTQVYALSGAGTYVFRLTATDTIGKQGLDTMQVNVVGASLRAYYGNNETGALPSPEDILNSSYVDFVMGDEFTIPFLNEGSPRYSWVAYAISAPQLNNWQDIVNPFNSGTVGSSGGLFMPYTSVDSYRVTITRYTTQFTNPIRFY